MTAEKDSRAAFNEWFQSYRHLHGGHGPNLVDAWDDAIAWATARQANHDLKMIEHAINWYVWERRPTYRHTEESWREILSAFNAAEQEKRG